ncbi:MAG: type II CAAX prenyl endopeptidase Rce1 family protein [Candidatus Heimdallarchaeota archaeon]
MKKFSIVEIEDSYLNFFTPAIIIASGYFLINLIDWPLSLLPWAVNQARICFDFNLLFLLLPIISSVLVSLIVYFVFIPRLKVIDAEYRPLTKRNLILVLILFCVAMTIRISYTNALTDLLGASIEPLIPWYLGSYRLLLFNPMYVYLFLIGRITIHIFSELLYRRTAIPALEDRGLGPSHAVIISSIGFILLDLPYYLTSPNLLSNIFWLGSTFIYAVLTGFIYVFTRNMLYCFLYAVVYDFYKLTDILGSELNIEFLASIHEAITLIALITGTLTVIYFIVTISISRSQLATDWLKTLRTPSAPNIGKGVVGFNLIAFGLVFSQYIISTLIKAITQFRLPDYVLFHTMFFLAAFTIPFWLSITTEYALD